MANINDFMHGYYNYNNTQGLQQIPSLIDSQIEEAKNKKNPKVEITKKKSIDILPKITDLANIPTSFIVYLIEKIGNAISKKEKPLFNKPEIEEIQHKQKKKSDSTLAPDSTFMFADSDKKINAKSGLLNLENNTWKSINTSHSRYSINESVISNRLSNYIVVKLYEPIDNPEFEYLGDSKIDKFPIYAYKGNNFLSYNLLYKQIVSV